MSQQRYHTDLIIRYQLGILPDAFTTAIPASTRHEWKTRDLARLVGSELATDWQANREMIAAFLGRKRLLRAAKALYVIHHTYVQVMQSGSNAAKVLREKPRQILAAIERAKPLVGLNRALRAFGISVQQYHAWQRKLNCEQSLIGWCRKLRPDQLSQCEVAAVKRYLSDPATQHWSSISVYWQMVRDGAATLSPGTWCKYAKLLGLERRQLLKRIAKPPITGIRADKPLALIHADVTIYCTLDHTRVYIYFILDNFSRAILGWRTSLYYSSAIALENLREVCQNHNLLSGETVLLADDGPVIRPIAYRNGY